MKFYRKALHYVTSTISSTQRDILASNLVQSIYQQSSLLTLMGSVMCENSKNMNKLHAFLLSTFPDAASEYLYPSNGYKIQAAGDGFLLRKCSVVRDYKIIWSREFNGSCYATLPILLSTGKLSFLHLPEREIGDYAKTISCKINKPILLIRDYANSIWSLYSNGSLTNSGGIICHLFRE